MDGLHLSIQNKKTGKSKKKIKKEIKLGIIYEGWQPRNSSKKEYSLVNKRSYITFKNAKHFKELGELHWHQYTILIQ